MHVPLAGVPVALLRTAVLVALVAIGLSLLTPPASEAAAPTPPAWPTAEPDGETDQWVDPLSAGHAWGDEVPGVLTFRGNPTRTYYGQGPVPTDPVELWSYPDAPMCSTSFLDGVERGWCGTGWTGQPSVFERDGRTWVLFGAYDQKFHFLDGDTGEEIIPSFVADDLFKGSATVDPDGFPIVYAGSLDDHLYALAFDRDEPTVLWKHNAYDVVEPVWNDDWDAAPLVVDDYLFQGGENSHWYIWKLNRGYDADGLATLDPELVFVAPGFDDQLFEDLGHDNISIESSLAISGDTVWFNNSGGLLQGWDISGLRDGRDPERIFRFWTGDDTDATTVIDDEGYLYVAVEVDRPTDRSREVGQILKLDPRRPDDPVVWAIHDEDRSGVWATPAIHRDLLIVPTSAGWLHGIDRATGEIRWRVFLRGPTWQSPVIVDDVLIQGDCRGGVLRGYDVSDTSVQPPQIWGIELGGCVESTPTVWDGRIYVGTRAGFFHAVGNLPEAPLVRAPGGESGAVGPLSPRG
ncbi:MAG: outer membrane protein assembly factor BamB family protein [Acidimicrobiales bacterium]